MFNKLQQGKDLLKMRQQAKKLEKELEQIEHVEEGGGIKVKVNGAQQIVYIEIDGGEQGDLTDLINKAFKNVQKKAAKKVMEMGGGISGLFGG
ncbi:MAG: YbaB/EbfC family nucleoid-associated protein [Patescibacteria group bacterium]